MTSAPQESLALRAVLGPGPQVHELRLLGDPKILYDEELRTVDLAVDSRRREFAAGRACAHIALEHLGHMAYPLLPGPDRDPLWPVGIIGSITHCKGFAGSAVARADNFLAIGIDAEPSEPLPPDITALVLNDAERVQVERLSKRFPRIPWSRIVFCVKEAVFKSWYPLRKIWLGFEDAYVCIRPNGTFLVRILHDDLGQYPSHVKGHWTINRGVIVVGLIVPRI